MPRCWVALGGDIGDVARTFAGAIDALSKAWGVSLVAVSRNYRTMPMGDAAADPFLNAVAGFDVTRPPLEFLNLLQTVEQNLGRVRTLHWGPRTLDLDLLYFGNEVLHVPRLTVPHPGVWHRRFVLDPFVEIVPSWVDPVWNLTISALRDRLLALPQTITIFGASDWLRDQLQQAVSQHHPAIELRHNDVSAALAGGLVIQIGTVVTPPVPRFRFGDDVAAETLIPTVIHAATAAFDAPQEAQG
jgi:2-amino-4-hydroxy-6-hydroxymethyldihydropteridine diphosphokinase